MTSPPSLAPTLRALHLQKSMSEVYISGETGTDNAMHFILTSVVCGVYCGLHINLQPPHPGLERETGIYIVFDYGTSILGQKYRDFEDCSYVEG